MNIDRFSDMPEWNDNDDLDGRDEGESWKPNPTKDACKLLYEKWSTIMIMLNACLRPDKPVDDDNDEAAMDLDYKSMMLGDAMQVAAKIRSSEAAGIYVCRMENASIIRKNAQGIQSAMLSFMAEETIEKSYGEVIRNEIEEFKKLFKNWVNTFEKDEFTDDWGLFV